VLKGLKADELGRVQIISVRVRWCRPQKYYDLSPWRGTYSMDGGSLTNQGIHHLDLLKQLGGNVKRVISTHKTLGVDIEVEDTGVALVEFENGALGTIEITTAARPIDYEASISIVGDKGLAEIGGVAVNELRIYTPDPNSCKIFSEDFSGNVYGNGHEKIYKDIFESMVSDKQYPTNFEDVYSTIKLLDNLYKSDEKNTWINFNDSDESIRLGRHDLNLELLYK
jgi:UDP-N-acetyl-2-amino-2-deoxyglucuronate dehydrogenase